MLSAARPPRARRTTLALLAATALVAGPLALPASAAPVDVQILGFNDFHGRLEAASPVPGAAALAGRVAELRAANPNTVVVSAGDNIGASTFVSAVQDDLPTIDALDAMGVAVSAVGNHEFDRGYADLVETVGVDGSGAASFPYLGANVEGESPALPESEVVEVGGVRIGFIGVVTQETPSLVAAGGIAGITFTDPLAAANRVAAEIDDEVDATVLLVHEGSPSADCADVTDPATPFGAIVTGLGDEVDAVLSGHTHVRYSCAVEDGDRTVPVLQTGSYGESLDQLVLTVDAEAGTVVPRSYGTVDVASAAPDPAVAAIVADAVAQADVVGAVQVGETTAPIARAKTPEGGDDRGTESVLGNFVADVQLAATAPQELGGAQIAFMNPGGLRADLDAGPVTYSEAAEVQPFANGLVTMTLTGAQVLAVLEEQWQPEGSSRPVLALGVSEGFAFTYDPAAPRGAHVTGATLGGAPLDPAASYRVTVNSFLATGGDNFTTLAEGTDRQDNGFNDLNVLVDHLEASSPVTPDAAPRRSVAAAAPTTPSTPTTPATTTGGTGTPSAVGVRTGTNRGLTVRTGVDVGLVRAADAEDARPSWGAGVLGLVLVAFAAAGAVGSRRLGGRGPR